MTDFSELFHTALADFTELSAAAADLSTVLTGEVFTPTDAGFAEELSGFNLATVHHPLAVVAVASEQDVAEAVGFAAANRLPVRVQATGHGAHTPIVDGIVISTGRLTGVTVDRATRTAVVEAGARWSAVVAAAAAVGLAPVTGAAPSVGVVGYLLGGGLGPLSRSHGVSSDRARRFRVVTGTGEVVDASAATNPDLYWALRGGKGGLGVVTEVELELVEIPALYAGSLLFAEEHIEQVVRGWVDFTASAPDDVTTSIAIMRMPPLEVIPEPLRGRTLVSLRFAYPGAADRGEALAAPLRALAPVYLDALGPLPVDQVGTIHGDPGEATPAWSSGLLLEPVDQDFVTTLLAAVGPEQQVPYVVVEVRHLGGATRVDVPEGSAVGGRSGAYTLVFVGVPDPALFTEALPDLTDRIVASLDRWVAPVTTINFASHQATAEQYARAWSPEQSKRLATVRAAYDPHGLFPHCPALA